MPFQLNFLEARPPAGPGAISGKRDPGRLPAVVGPYKEFFPAIVGPRVDIDRRPSRGMR